MATLAQMLNFPGADQSKQYLDNTSLGISFNKASSAINDRITNSPSPTTYSNPVSDLASKSTYRGLFSNWFNGRKIAAEDYLRSEESARNAFGREASFNAAEAQKQRDFEERMSRNAYTYAIEDLKRNGINPILAYGGTPASTPSGASARSSGGSSSYRGSSVQDSATALLLGVAQIIGGLYMKNAELTASGANQVLGTSTSQSRYNSKGKLTGSTVTTQRYLR